MSLLTRIEKMERAVIGSKRPSVVYIERTGLDGTGEVQEAVLTVGKRGPQARMERTLGETTAAFRERVKQAAATLQQGSRTHPKQRSPAA